MYFSLELKLKKENENDVTYTSFAKKKDKPYLITFYVPRNLLICPWISCLSDIVS